MKITKKSPRINEKVYCVLYVLYIRYVAYIGPMHNTITKLKEKDVVKWAATAVLHTEIKLKVEKKSVEQNENRSCAFQIDVIFGVVVVVIFVFTTIFLHILFAWQTRRNKRKINDQKKK